MKQVSYRVCLSHKVVDHSDISAQIREDFVAKLEWGTSFVESGEDPAAQPCAKPGCSPWPTCCQIDELSMKNGHKTSHITL